MKRQFTPFRVDWRFFSFKNILGIAVTIVVIAFVMVQNFIVITICVKIDYVNEIT